MLSPEQVRQYRTDGFTVCQGFLPEGEVDRFREEIEGICAGNTLANHDSTLMEMEPAQPPEGTRVRRIYQPCHHFPEFGVLSHSDRLLDCVEQLLGPDLLIQYSKINMKPADVGSVVEWHQDLAYYPLTNRGSLAVLFYLGRRQPKQRLPEDHPRPPQRALAEPHAGRPCSRDGLPNPWMAPERCLWRAEPEPPSSCTAWLPMHRLPTPPHGSGRTLILSYRAADAFRIYDGENTTTSEAFVRLVRGRPSQPGSL